MTRTASDLETAIAAARALVAQARQVVVLTGAGISTDSGIPDFRGPQGLWTRDPAAEKMATLSHYVRDPAVRRASWQAKLAASRTPRQPNAGHLALVALERQARLHTLITQNVDGLHQQAGSDPERVIEIHGTLRDVICLACGERRPMQSALARVEAGEADPACRRCGGILKSATISFGQDLVPGDLARAEQAARDCDLLLAVGSTLAVQPIAGVVPLARHAGAGLVIVNGERTQMDPLADVVLRGSISEILPRLLA